MRRLKNVMIGLVSFTLLACHSGKNSSAPRPPVNQKGSGVCVPEANLLAKGIVKGEIVKKEDSDSKTVHMLLSGSQICTAAPIGDNVILTAAHCVSDNPKESVAAFHVSLSCESGFNATKHTIRAKKVVKHPGYDASLKVEERTGDIALVFLESKIPETYPIYKIADPQAISGGGSMMYLYGYGIIGENMGGRGILRRAFVNQNDYSVETANRKVRVNQYEGPGICMGDSGGPSLVQVNGQLQILGINSYVLRTSDRNANGAPKNICNDQSYQTLVAAFSDWIYTEMALMKTDDKNSK